MSENGLGAPLPTGAGEPAPAGGRGIKRRGQHSCQRGSDPVAGCAARVLMARISTRALLGKARIEEEGRTARINALGKGGTLQERDLAGHQLVVCQGILVRGKTVDRRADDTAAAPGARQRPVSAAEAGYSYQEDQPYLIRFLLRHGATFPEAEDAVHSAFVELMRWQPVQRPRPWLRTVALRAFLRQTVPEQPENDLTGRLVQTSADWHTPLHAAELNEQQRWVLTTLLQLPFKQRSVMAWHLDGFSHR